MQGRRGASRIRTQVALIALGLVGALLVPLPFAGPADAGLHTLSGRVEGLGAGLSDLDITVFEAGSAAGAAPIAIATTTTGPLGGFDVSFGPPGPDAVLYVLAKGTPDASMTLATVLGQAPRPANIVVNERTTVAAGFSLAQFTSGGQVGGPSPGMLNAAGMAANIAQVDTGAFSPVLLTPPNHDTSTKNSVNSLSNMVGACVEGPAGCTALLTAAAPPNGPAPINSFQAMADIAANPTQTDGDLYDLTSGSWATYGPTLEPAPESWTIPIRFWGDGKSLDGPGNIAVDHEGNLWVNNNYEWKPDPLDAVCGSNEVFKFSPTGEFIDGSPFSGGGLSGAGFGIDVDVFGDVWVGNYGFAAPGCPDKPPHNSVSKFSPDGTPLSPTGTGWTDGGISWPQATVSDQQGNIWMANCGNGSVTRYPLGDHTAAEQYTDLGLEKPFGIAFNHDGRAFVTGAQSSTVALLEPDGTPAPGSPISGSAIANPMGAAANSDGDIWIANSGIAPPPCGEKATPSPTGASVTLLGSDRSIDVQSQTGAGGLTWAWGIVVDGVDNVWVSNFADKRLSHICGRDNSPHCPPGLGAGDAISPDDSGYYFDGLVRVTGLTVDTAGHVWLMNNWKEVPVQSNPGGYEIVAYVGVAAPVQPPAPIPRPAPTPTTTTTTTAAASPVSLQPTFTG